MWSVQCSAPFSARMASARQLVMGTATWAVRPPNGAPSVRRHVVIRSARQIVTKRMGHAVGEHVIR